MVVIYSTRLEKFLPLWVFLILEQQFYFQFCLTWTCIWYYMNILYNYSTFVCCFLKNSCLSKKLIISRTKLIKNSLNLTTCKHHTTYKVKIWKTLKNVCWKINFSFHIRKYTLFKSNDDYERLVFKYQINFLLICRETIGFETLMII